MNNRTRVKLLLGPYKPPRCLLGKKLFCEIRGWVPVRRISAGRIQWPQTVVGRSRAFILTGDLVKAVRHESNQAICHWWGVTPQTVTVWRKALDVPEHNEGTRRLFREWFPESIPPQKLAQARRNANSSSANAKKSAAKRGKMPPAHVMEALWRANRGRPLSAEHRRKLSAVHKARGTRPPTSMPDWLAREDALLGTMPDEQVAKRTGRTLIAVRCRRWLLDIDGFYRKRRRRPGRLSNAT
jgi:hypothetical protein